MLHCSYGAINGDRRVWRAIIPEEEPGTSGSTIVTINPVALSKAGTAQQDIMSDLERGWSTPAQKRTGIKIAFRVSADGPTFGPASGSGPLLIIRPCTSQALVAIILMSIVGNTMHSKSSSVVRDGGRV